MNNQFSKPGGFYRGVSGLLAGILFFCAHHASAAQIIQALPFYDSFDYTPSTANGLAVVSTNVWATCYTTANIQVTNGSLSLPGFVPSAGNSVIGAVSGTRFAGTQFAAQTNTDGNTVYLSFLYQATAYPTTSPGVIAFLDSTNVGTSSGAAMPAHAGLALLMDHTGHIGINSGATGATGAVFESTATPTNTTVLIVARYTFHPAGKDTVDLWVNPASANYGAASAPVSDETLSNTYNLSYVANFTISYRGGDTSFGEKWDEVRIGSAWAQVVPSSVTPGPASAPHSVVSSATPNSIIANGASTSIVKMQARDINGVNLTTGGATVTFATTLGAIGSTTDNGNGSYQATLTSSTNAGNAIVTAKLGGTNIATIGSATNSPSLTVNFTLGPVSAAASTAVASPTTVAADGLTTSTITITAMDGYNHPLAGQTVLLNVSGSSNTVSTPAPTGVTGQTTATIASTVAETKTITVTIGSTQINAQPTVNFTALGVSAANSTALAAPSTGLTADGVSTSTITVTAISGAGSPLSGQTVTVSATGSGNILIQPASSTDANGHATATLQSTVAETKTVTVNIAGTVISAQPTVTFVPGPATQIVFTAEPVTTAVNVTIPNVVVQIEDQTGNPVPQSGAVVNLTLSAGTLSGTNPRTTDSSGKVTFNDLSIQSISYGLYLTANVAGFNPAQSTLFNIPPKVFYKVANTTALNLASSWTSIEGGPGPAGPPAFDGLGEWDTNSSGGTVDIGASASWYGMVLGANGALTITDTNGGHTLTLGAGSLDGSPAIHSVTMNNTIALSADQTWKWSSNAYTLTIASNLNNGGHTLTINGFNGNGPEKFNGAISGGGGLTLMGSSSVTLSGTNTFTGNTTVSSGKLILNTNGSIANSPAIVLSSGATLDVSVASPYTVLAGQTLSGDTNGSGTATIAASTTNGPGNFILAPNALVTFNAVGNAGADFVTTGLIKILGGATLNGNAITINVTGAPLPPGDFTLITATNGFATNGSMPTPTITGLGVATGYVGQIVINGQNMQLQVALPPGTFSVSPTLFTNNCGDSATFTATAAAGVTNYQWYDPSLNAISEATNASLVLTGTHPSGGGAYTIVETGPTWVSTNTVVLLTTDTNPPLITLNGASPTVIALGSNYTELGATAYDTCAGNNLSVNITGSVNTNVAGTYDITYSAVTAGGTPGSLMRAVQVVYPPLTNLVVTPSPVTPQCGSNVTFTASVAGLPPITYQWFDNNTNAITNATNASYTLVTPTDSSVGNYTVIAQNAYNSLTNFATVTTVLHTAPPVMALNGANPVNLLVNSPYVDAGATAFDLCAQTNLTVSSNNPVNTSLPGTYTVTYSATTADGTPGTITRTVAVNTIPDFGPNVLIFDPSMTNIQSQLDAVYAEQKYNQFGTQRYALLFKQGQYSNLDIPVGYYTQILGLGQSPDDTAISCYLHSDGVLVNENATVNFWRSVENLAIVPTNAANYMMWAVSQGTALRRLHVAGTLDLANFTDGNFASGGFLADSKVDATVSSISQQQWLSRNDVWSNWDGGVWNMVFVGVSNPPVGAWPAKVYTVITNTPLIREKPYLYLDSNGNYAVWVPALETNSLGITWASGPTPGTSIPIGQFYIAQAGVDNVTSINAALASGLNLILTPGVYQLNGSLQVTRADTVILGLGYPTLIPQTGTPALVVSDVNGVKIGGLLFDAGPVPTTTLLQVGTATSTVNHAADPIFLYDISMRVGGAVAGSTLSCLQINANDVVGDNLWLWRADHGNGVGWTQNVCDNGLIVNGDRVTMYGLFVEHHEQYETLWNGNWGRLYFYQSELPYDPPTQDAWSHDGEEGYASIKVADTVTSFQAYGLGIYAVFIDSTNISCFNAIETPTNCQQVDLHDIITVYIAGDTSGSGTSSLNHVINGIGATLSGPGFGGTATFNSLWPDPAYNINASVNGNGAAISFPTESWHSYQVQYKNTLADSNWFNLGQQVNGNDVLQTITDPTVATNRFFQVLAH